MSFPVLSFRGRRIVLALAVGIGVLLFAQGVRERERVFYARDKGADAVQGATSESLQAISGGGQSRWAPDTSKHEDLGSLDMIEHATTGGVARTDGVLHLTGKNACPT